MDLNGQVELHAEQRDGKLSLQQPYDGKLVATFHATQVDDDPEAAAVWADDVAHKLDRFMRDHNLSRLEAYWNAVPPEDDDER